MKKALFFLVALVGFTFWGCDYVVVPNQPHTVVIPTSDTVHKIFIEDFTGHTCANCPRAARTLDSLRARYPQRVIGMAVHIDFYAAPCPPNTPNGALPGTFTEDFRTPEDADYLSIFSIGFYPSGLVNRVGPADPSTWSASAATLLADSMTAYLKITPAYVASTHTLNVTVTGEFLCDTTGTYNIALYLVEDGLTGSQVDNTLPSPSIDNSYVFNDVLRGCINSPGTISGQLISTPTNITGHTQINYTSPAYTVNSSYNPANCKIIAILINNADRGVLQAAECSLQ